MIFTRHTSPAKRAPLRQGSIITIGAYDGLHLGHQALLGEVLDGAAEHRLVSVVVSFEPTPKEYFAAERAPARLMRFQDKYRALERLDVDLFYCPRFDRRMAALEPSQFAKQLIVDQLNARHVIIGDDFRYARDRTGDVSTLIASGQEFGFSVSQVASVIVDGERVSSTAIRKALKSGDMHKARDFLGRWFSMAGRVIEGKKLGRTLGFPTANIAVGRRVRPVHGIYAVRVQGVDNHCYDGVASIGTRPSVDDGQVLLEVHLFDFDQSIYGQTLSVDFVAFLRSEEKFATMDALVAQMHKDLDAARDVLNKTKDLDTQ